MELSKWRHYSGSKSHHRLFQKDHHLLTQTPQPQPTSAFINSAINLSIHISFPARGSVNRPLSCVSSWEGPWGSKSKYGRSSGADRRATSGIKREKNLSVWVRSSCRRCSHTMPITFKFAGQYRTARRPHVYDKGLQRRASRYLRSMQSFVDWSQDIAASKMLQECETYGVPESLSRDGDCHH